MTSNEVTKINLLPWRKNHLLFENRKFAAIAATIFVVGFLLTYSVAIGVNLKNDMVNSNIKHLKKEVKVLGKKIKDIKGLKEQKEILLNKMAVIQNLQRDRLNIVRLFNSLAEATPVNIYLEDVAREGKTIYIDGVSDDNSAISTFMRNLEKHNILTKTDLNKIQMNSSGNLDFYMETQWNEEN